MIATDADQQLTKWVTDYSDVLFAFAQKRLNDRELAKDMIQDTFLSTWKNIDKFQGDASVKTWLFTILKNKIIDHYRRQSTQTVVVSLSAKSDDEYFDTNDHWETQAYPKEWARSTDALIQSKEFFGVLALCKSKLKATQNMVFNMKYIDGYESEEICKALDLTPSNYWVLIHRSKLQLRACLEKNWMLK